jgi:hypothetical protein
MSQLRVPFSVPWSTSHRASAELVKHRRTLEAIEQGQWVFDQPSYGSQMWFHPKWAHMPENAIGVTEAGLELLIESSELRLLEHHQGNWKEVPGIFFQDVLIFQKS